MKSSPAVQAPAVAPEPAVAAVEAPVLRRPSQAWQQLTSGFPSDAPLAVLDLGCTSSSNFRFFVDRGDRLHHFDLLGELSASTGMPGSAPAPADFLAANLNQAIGSLDVILLWDVLDYVPHDYIRPLVDRLSLSMRPGASLLALFHSREAGVEPTFYQYHIQDRETIEWRPQPNRPIQHFFHVRHVENLFSTFHSIRFFLGQQGTREVLMVR